MYRIYRAILDSFQGDFDFSLKNSIFLKDFYSSFPGVSLMMREVSHICTDNLESHAPTTRQTGSPANQRSSWKYLNTM